jgi:streptomycin 6-kinase
LEDAGAILLSQYHSESGDLAASRVILNVVKQLHSAGNADIPPALISMRDHFDSLFQMAETIENSFLGENLRWAANLADHLVATQSATRPLHGDIHHENIVSSDRQHWNAIDPQGLIGEPAYDVANVFGNPLNSSDLVLNIERINALATFFADGLQVQRERIVKFAAAHAGVSVCWSMRGGGTLESDADMNECFELLRLLRTMIEG